MFFNKEGKGHIEMVMSFLLFLGFISFAFYFFSPFHNPRTLHSSLDYAFDEIVKNTSISLEKYSVFFPSSCVNETMRINSTIPSGHIKVYDMVGKYHGGRENGSVWCFTHNLPYTQFVEVLVSEEYSPGGGTCNLHIDCGEVSSSEKRKVISNKKVKSLIINYYNLSTQSYLDLKDYFNLPGSVNFGFSLISDDGTTVNLATVKTIPSNIEVISKKDRVEVILDEDVGLVFADLVVKVW